MSTTTFSFSGEIRKNIKKSFGWKKTPKKTHLIWKYGIVSEMSLNTTSLLQYMSDLP